MVAYFFYAGLLGLLLIMLVEIAGHANQYRHKKTGMHSVKRGFNSTHK